MTMTDDRLALRLAEQTDFWAGGLQHSRAILVSGDVDPSAVAASCAEIQRRHPVLRRSAGEGSVECVAGVPRPLAAALTVATADASHPFAMDERPAIRVGVYPVDGGRTLVVLTLHAALGGPSAAARLLAELGETDPSPPSPVDEAAPRLGSVLSGAPPAVTWPAGRGRGRGQGRSITRAWALPDSHTAILRRFAGQVGVSPAAVLRCALRVLLHRETGEPDLLIGSPADRTGGTPIAPEDIRIHRHTLSATASFTDAVRAEHAGAPLDLPGVLGVLLSRPLRPDRHGEAEVQVGFRSRVTSGTPGTWAGLPARDVDLPVAHSLYELELEVTLSGDRLAGVWRGGVALFDEETLDRMGRSYTTLLDRLVRCPGEPLGAADVIHPADRARLAAWEAPTPGVSGTDTVVDLVARWIRDTPASSAVVLADDVLTYAELDDTAARVAAALDALRLPAETPIGILVARRVELPAILLGVARAGLTAVPLDPGHPAERLAYVVGDSGCARVITDGTLPIDRVEALGVPAVPLSGLLTAEPAPAGRSPHPDSLAYVLYTSGSTGRPKGVAVTHRGLANCLVATRELLDIRPGRSLLAVTTISFDIAMLELFLALTGGGRTILATSAQARNGPELQAVLARHRPDVMQATPMTWRILFATGWPGDPDLIVSCGGDVVPPELASRLVACTRQFWHTYGPTETSMYAVCERLPREPQESIVPVGRPLPGVWLRILGATGAPVPPGVIGELHIGGVGVARGYVGAPGQTAERFVADPAGGGRLYRTGDLARWRPDGRLELRGRNDRQVKIRGHRIEPDEIESVLNGHPDIAVAAIVVVGRDSASRSIVAFLQPRQPEAGPELVTRVAAHARQVLPAYMVPSSFALLGAMPLTTTGKVDRTALARIEPPRPATAATDADAQRIRRDRLAAGASPLRWSGRAGRPALVLLQGDTAWPAEAVAEFERWFRVATLDVCDAVARLATLAAPGAAVLAARGELATTAARLAHTLGERIGAGPKVLAIEPPAPNGPEHLPHWVASRDHKLLRAWREAAGNAELVLLAPDTDAATEWSLLASVVAAMG